MKPLPFPSVHPPLSLHMFTSWAKQVGGIGLQPFFGQSLAVHQCGGKQLGSLVETWKRLGSCVVGPLPIPKHIIYNHTYIHIYIRIYNMCVAAYHYKIQSPTDSVVVAGFGAEKCWIGKPVKFFKRYSQLWTFNWEETWSRRFGRTTKVAMEITWWICCSLSGFLKKGIYVA